MSSARASISCSAVSWLRPIVPLLLLLVSLPAVCEDVAIALRAAGPALVEARTRQTLSVMLFADNLSAEPLELVLNTLLPEGWKELTADGPFRVEARTTASRLSAILVPPRARAGPYTVSFRIRAAADASAQAQYDLQVKVLPEPAVEVRLLESPPFVAAGDRYQALFSLSNPGNADMWIELSVQSRPDFPMKLSGVEDPRSVLVLVGEQRELAVEVSTPSGLRTATQATLTLTAHSLEFPESEPATASSRVEIVPVSSGSTRLLRTMGGYSETTVAAFLDAEPDAYAESSLKASGALDEDGRHRLAIEIRKRLGTDDETFANPIDRYSFTYRNRFTELLLGDHNYSLSPLLAMNEFGRGAQAAAILGPIGLKTFYFENNWWETGQANLGGVAADFTLPGKGDRDDPLYRAGFSLLSPLDGRATYGLWQRFHPVDLLSLEIDAALQSDPDGSVHPALFAEAEGDPGRWYYRTRFLRAWTGFEGNYADTQSFLLSSGLRLLDRALDLHGSYVISDDNLELDPLLDNADRDRRLRLGAALKALPWGSQFSLDWENTRRLDRLVPVDYDNLENLVRLGWKQQLGGAFGLKFDSSLGRAQYPLTGTGAFSQGHGITLSWEPSASRRADASVNFTGQRGDSGTAWYSLGWNAGAYRAWERTRLDGRIVNRYYFSGAGFSGLHGGLESTLAHSFRWGHSLSTSAYFGLSYDPGEAAVPDLRLTIKYGVPLNIPVGRRPEIAVVHGRVYRVETGEPVKGIVLRLNGLAVATDSKGEYAFHLAQAGRLYLQVDRERMPADLILNRPIPIEVDVTEGDSRLDIGLVRAGEVLGSVVGYGLPEEASSFVVGQSPESPEGLKHVRLGGFGNVLIEISDGAERRRRLTGPNGDFRFPDLRPGHYTLKVGEGFIPRYYTLERPVWEFDIAAGQQETVEIRAIQDQRRVRLVQAEMSVTLEGAAAQHGEWTVTLQPKSEPAAAPQPAGAAISPAKEPVPKPPAPIEPAPELPPQPEKPAQPAPDRGAPAEPVEAAAASAEPASATAPPAPAAGPAARPEIEPPAAASVRTSPEPKAEAPAAAADRAPGGAPSAPGAPPAAPPAAAAEPAGEAPAPTPEAGPTVRPEAEPAAAPPPAAPKAESPAASKATPPAAPKAAPPAAPKATIPAASKAAPATAPKAAPAAPKVEQPVVTPTPAPAPLVLPAPEPTPRPLLFFPAPLPTPAPLILVPGPAPAPLEFPAPEPTPSPYFFLPTPAPTPAPSSE